VPDVLFAAVGPLTNFVEAVAGSIGSGVLVGGFLGGMESGLLGRPRRGSERKALMGSYIGGFASLAALAIDILMRHFV
jgi:hypothetical protein